MAIGLWRSWSLGAVLDYGCSERNGNAGASEKRSWQMLMLCLLLNFCVMPPNSSVPRDIVCRKGISLPAPKQICSYPAGRSLLPVGCIEEGDEYAWKPWQGRLPCRKDRRDGAR